MKGISRYSKEAGVKVCDCECMVNKDCPAAKDNKCRQEWERQYALTHQPLIIRID
jgi:hypothetical protein